MATTTRPRAAVREALLHQPGFRSAQDIYAALRAGGHGIGLSTVYRHLQTFAEQGMLDVIHTPDGETTYRLCGPSAQNTKHHHHLVCRSCGTVEEVEGRAIEQWTDRVARRHGYVDVDHTVEVFGVCAGCTADPRRTPGR